MGLEQAELAKMSGVARSTVVDFENEVRTPRQGSVDAIRAALESAGVEFIAENGGGAGVRLRKWANGDAAQLGLGIRGTSELQKHYLWRLDVISHPSTLGSIVDDILVNPDQRSEFGFCFWTDGIFGRVLGQHRDVVEHSGHDLRTPDVEHDGATASPFLDTVGNSDCRDKSRLWYDLWEVSVGAMRHQFHFIDFRLPWCDPLA